MTVDTEVLSAAMVSGDAEIVLMLGPVNTVFIQLEDPFGRSVRIVTLVSESTVEVVTVFHAQPALSVTLDAEPIVPEVIDQLTV